MSDKEAIWAHSHPVDENSTAPSRGDSDESRIQNPFDQEMHKRWPIQGLAQLERIRFKEHIDFELRKLVVYKSKVALVELQTLSVDVSTISTAMAIGTKSDEIVIGVFSAGRPRDDMMNFNLNVAARGNGAPMASFNQDPSFKISGDRRS